MSTETQPTAVSPLLIRPLQAGEACRPYNYEKLGRFAGERRFQPRPGYTVLGAFRSGILVGCAEFSVCGEEALLSSGEYNNGWPLNGPFFRDPSAAAGERFLLLHSLWVDPGERQAGIGAMLCAELEAHGLAGYAEFASDWVCGWFHRRFSPAVCRQRMAVEHPATGTGCYRRTASRASRPPNLASGTRPSRRAPAR